MKKTIRKKKKVMKWTRYPRYKKELACEHGVGHGGMHGCDGCCADPSFKTAWKRIFKEDYMTHPQAKEGKK